MDAETRKTLEAIAECEDGAAEEAEDFQGAIPLAEEYRRGAAAIRAALAEVDALTQQVADLEARAIPPEWVESLDNRTLWVSLESPGDGTRDVCVRYHDGVATIERVVGTDRMFLETRMPLSAALSAATEAP